MTRPDEKHLWLLRKQCRPIIYISHRSCTSSHNQHCKEKFLCNCIYVALGIQTHGGPAQLRVCVNAVLPLVLSLSINTQEELFQLLEEYILVPKSKLNRPSNKHGTFSVKLHVGLVGDCGSYCSLKHNERKMTDLLLFFHVFFKAKNRPPQGQGPTQECTCRAYFKGYQGNFACTQGCYTVLGILSLHSQRRYLALAQLAQQAENQGPSAQISVVGRAMKFGPDLTSITLSLV